MYNFHRLCLIRGNTWRLSAAELIFVLFVQSARMRAAGVGKDFKENPNLRDNWTDAEGYYRKCCLSRKACTKSWNLKDRIQTWTFLSVPPHVVSGTNPCSDMTQAQKHTTYPEYVCTVNSASVNQYVRSHLNHLASMLINAFLWFFRGEHRWDAGQTLWCVWLHWPGCIQQRDQSQGHCQGRPGGGSQDHPKQWTHVSHTSYYNKLH